MIYLLINVNINTAINSFIQVNITSFAEKTAFMVTFSSSEKKLFVSIGLSVSISARDQKQSLPTDVSG